jgi:hypothetical protein
LSAIALDIYNIDVSGGLGYALITFPNRTKILNATFILNPEAYGSVEDARDWELHALIGHPYVEEGQSTETVWSIFNESAKPVVTRADNLLFRSNTSPTGIYTTPGDDTRLDLEAHYGVLNSGDYLVVWINPVDGDFESIVWEATKATVTLEYDDTTKGSIYELSDWAPINPSS